MESTPEAHMQRVKERLQSGREILERLSNLATYNLQGTKPDIEQITLPPPLPDDYFYVAGGDTRRWCSPLDGPPYDGGPA